MLNGLPQLDVKINIVWVRCHYSKAHQLLYKELKFGGNKPLELIHSFFFFPSQANINQRYTAHGDVH